MSSKQSEAVMEATNAIMEQKQEDGSAALSAAQVQDILVQAATVNLDEVTIGEIAVAFVEWVEVKATGNDGQTVTRIKPQVRHAHISDYVPMYLLNKMVASQKKAQRARDRFQAGDEEFTQDPMMAWVSEQVLAVWKLSEPDMTQERFNRGLNFQQINGLFTRFFGEQLRLSKNKA